MVQFHRAFASIRNHRNVVLMVFAADSAATSLRQVTRAQTVAKNARGCLRQSATILKTLNRCARLVCAFVKHVESGFEGFCCQSLVLSAGRLRQVRLGCNESKSNRIARSGKAAKQSCWKKWKYKEAIVLAEVEIQ